MKIGIVGAGPAAIHAALVLSKVPGLEITIYDIGNSVEKRNCPKETIGHCGRCAVCNVLCGLAGGGAGSDGKLLRTKGGNLPKLIGDDKIEILYNYVYNDYMYFSERAGICPGIYGEEDTPYILQLGEKAMNLNMMLEHPPITHFGTEGSKSVYYQMQQHLKSRGVIFKFNSKVIDIDMSQEKKKIIYRKAGSKYEEGFDFVMLSPGRFGSDWLAGVFEKYKIKSEFSKIIVGVRAELPNGPMTMSNEDAYESKFRMLYDGKFVKSYKSFCQCPGGMISYENYGKNGIAVNGHSYQFIKTDNTNVSLLADIPYTSPLITNPRTFIWDLVKAANKQGGGYPIVQRFEDFAKGVPTNEEGIRSLGFRSTENQLRPGDLTTVFPKEMVVGMIDFINRIDQCIPGFAVGGDLLLHGVEVKPVSFTPITDEHMQIEIPDIFVAGDGVNMSHGLLPASASGMYTALCMLKKISEITEISYITKDAIENVLNNTYKNIL